MKRFPIEAGLDRRPSDTAIRIHEPNDGASFEPFGPGGGASEKGLLIEYYRTFMRFRKLILMLALGGVVASVLLHLTTQPVYRTRTSLDIQSLNGDFMNIRSIDPTGASPSDTNVLTQMKLLQSDSLMDRVRQRLTEEPHAPFVERNDLLSRFRRLAHLGNSEPIPFEDLLNETFKGVKVKPLGLTRLVEVTCDSWDADFAARFCNTLTSEFQSEDLESRGSQAKRTSDWLMHQAADIREKAQDSQKRLLEAAGGNGLILSQETNTVGEDRLRQMQAELVKAQADRMEKEAQTNVARSSAPDSSPNVVDSAAYSGLRTRLVDLQSRVAALVPPLTEENPKVIHLRNEIKEVQDSMSKVHADSKQRLNNEYSAAKHREDLLALAYHAQEATVSSDLQKGSQVILLRREVESEQQLYQTLLQRAKEAGFASAMQASTIRVVDVARRPRLSIYPQRLTAAAVGLILGLLVGIAIAFFKDRNTAVLRIPGESERFLHVAELGVIPSPGAGRVSLLAPRKSTGTLAKLDLSNTNQHNALQSARWDDNFSLVAEAYRNATLSILLSDTAERGRIYVVTSPSSGEGKTTVTSNLGVALSKSKLRVVLIDGDLRKPSLHRTMSVPNNVGLRNILRGEIDLLESSTSEFCRPTAFPQLFVIPSGNGKEEVVELLHSSRLSDLLERLAHEFDVILVDTPPMLHMADARIFARQAHGAILIFRSGVTAREQATSARDLLDNDRVRVVGTILNDFNPEKEGKGGYYKSYYAYQQQRDTEDGMAVRQ